MTEKARSALPAKLWSWHEHVCACQASGQTMVAYAKAHRLSVQAFYRAKARLLRYGAGQLSPLGSLFQRVGVVSAPPRLSSCRVHLPTGWSWNSGWKMRGSAGCCKRRARCHDAACSRTAGGISLS